MENKKKVPLKEEYEAPKATVVIFESEDVITTSGVEETDDNQGSWD